MSKLKTNSLTQDADDQKSGDIFISELIDGKRGYCSSPDKPESITLKNRKQPGEWDVLYHVSFQYLSYDYLRLTLTAQTILNLRQQLPDRFLKISEVHDTTLQGILVK